MTPETPTPFPVPEITHDPNHPPTLLDYDLHPPALSLLLDSLRNNHRLIFQKIFTPRRIVILGGLVKRNFTLEGPEVTQISIASSEALTAVFDRNYRQRRKGWLAGGFNPVTQDLYLYPDNLLLGNIAAAVKKAHTSHSQDISLMHNLKQDTHKSAGEFLVEELDHSYEPLSVLAPIFSFRSIVERRAALKKSDPRLQQLAQQALTLKPLISDQHILDLYSLARERYRLHQERQSLL